MSSSSRAPRNVPPPPGAKPASAYARFIPREELGDFAAWKPGNVSGEAGPSPSARGTAEPTQAASPPPPPSAEDWQARVDAARQSGYQDGYRDGLVALEGFKQSFATQATAQIGALLQSFEAQLCTLDRELAEAVARTAVQIARQVLRSELMGDPAIVGRVATEAANAVLLSARHITVYVHPQDLPLVADGAAEALEARGARLLPRNDIERGGVLVESDVGSVDARIAQRWALAAGALGCDEPWTPSESLEPVPSEDGE